jgi:hypothetical protein
MKLLPVLALSLLVSVSVNAAPVPFGGATPVPAATPSPEVMQLVQEGQAAYNKGDYATAKSAFEMAYQMDSRNLTAINYLTKLRALEKTRKGTVTPEQQLAGIMVPKVNLKDATVGSVFEYLRSMSSKLSDGKVVANFVLKIPDEQIKTQTVTLSLSNVPFTEVVKFVAELANLSVEYQQHAVVVTPKSIAPAPAPTSILMPESK